MPCSYRGGQSKKKSQKSKSKSRCVGGSGLETAVVPFGLLAIQQWFGTRSRNGKSKNNNKTRKNRK